MLCTRGFTPRITAILSWSTTCNRVFQEEYHGGLLQEENRRYRMCSFPSQCKDKALIPSPNPPPQIQPARGRIYRWAGDFFDNRAYI